MQDDDEAAPPPKQVSAPTLANNLNSDSPPAGKEQVLEEEEDEAKLELVEKSQLGKAISRQLREVYIPLEVWYLRSAIERVSLTVRISLAHSADCPP